VPQKSATNYRFHQRFRAIVKRIKNYAFSTKNELAKTLLWAKYSAFLSDIKKMHECVRDLIYKKKKD